MRIDTIIEAAEIVTLDPRRPRARRIGLHGGRIMGFDAELDGLDAAERLRTPGVIVPGFIDAHCHTVWWGLGLDAVDLTEVTSPRDLLRRLEAEAERVGEDWIHATGFNPGHLDGPVPGLVELDAATGDRPLHLRHASGHATVTNTAGLDLMGVLPAGVPDPPGGVIVRDAQGHPTGLLEEAAQGLLQALLLPYSEERIVQALDEATRRYAAQGITSFAEAGIGGGWIGHSPVEFAAYQRARREGRLHARAHVMPALDALHPMEGAGADFGGGPARGLDLGIGFDTGDDWLRLSHVKAFLDGSLLGATAAVTASLCGHSGHTGYLLDAPEAYRERILATARAGWPLALHAIGDAAIDLALDLIEEVHAAVDPAPAPHRIEHFGIARPDQVERAGRLGIAVTPQASFIAPLGDQFAALVGPEREAWLYRGASVLAAGAILAGSTDLPVADNDIRRCLQSAVDRRTGDGRVLAPEEALDPEQALHAHTRGAAIAMGRESDLGSLRPGLLADLTVLSGSPLEAEDIGALEILGTMVGGTLSHGESDLGWSAAHH